MSFGKFTSKDRIKIEEAYAVLAESAHSRCRSEEEFSIVQKAFDFANEAHKNVRRRSGEPYILHSIAVARIVVEEIGLGYKSISAALLHDVVEDTGYTTDDIHALFGDKIGALVDGLTKIKTVLDNEDRSGNLAVIQSESIQAENFKRILLTLGDDVRVVLIKLADRLHNCRTIEFVPEHKRAKVLSETMYIFIPLAHRLGLYSIKSEMENIWLKYTEPSEYKAICERVSKDADEHEDAVREFMDPIVAQLNAAGYRYSIKKRVKTPYSIWHKMHTKKVPFEQIYDLYAVRIIFESARPDAETERNDAYLIYSMVTRLYRDNPGRFRDWVKNPKPNGYEALHCTLMSKAGIWIEVQIRSKRMDDIAEKGIAAHWAYKEGGYSADHDRMIDDWLVKVQEILQSKDISSLELLDIIHNDLITKEITVFTPKGEQRSIPTGSTALDFAYQIHSNVGNKAIAAKVNMKLSPLSQVLKSGDQVEIISAKNACPKLEWLEFLHTRRAKKLVLEYIRDNSPEEAGAAEEILSAQREMFINNISADQVVMRQGVKYEIAGCCAPIPGDPVIGYKREDGTIVLHKKSCPQIENLASTHGERLVVPRWPDDTLIELPAVISLKGIDRKGLLNDITQKISGVMGLNMRSVNINAVDHLVEGKIEVLVKDRISLDNIVSELKSIEGIQDVERKEIYD